MSLLGRDEEKGKKKGCRKECDRDQIDGARILTQKKKQEKKKEKKEEKV